MPAARCLFLLISALALAVPLIAQTRDSTRLKDIVVTATRSPTPLHAVGSSTERLSPEELTRRQLSSLREALQLAPGGTVLLTGGPGGVTSLFLRGVASSQTLFLVDGVRVNDADASYGSLLGGVELSGFEQLEIVRGPQSTLYGGAAIGGVVSLAATRAVGPPRGELELEGGSFATWKGKVSAQGSARGLGAAVFLSANGTDNQRHDNDWRQRSQLVRLDYRLGAHWQAGASIRGMQNDYSSPGDLRSNNTTPAGTTSYDSKLGTLWLEATPFPRWQTKLLAGAGEQNSESSSRYNGGPESVFALKNSRRVLDWQNTFEPVREIVLVGGVNREWSTVVSDGAGLQQRLAGFYGELQLRPARFLAITAGLRSDDYNSFGRATTYRITGAWLIERTGTKFRASLGTGFMPPSLAARFGSAFQNPNPDIRPERSRGWDGGADQIILRGRGSLGVTWFHNSLRDLLGFESALFPEKGRSVNIDRARTSGLEISGRLASGPLDARLAYTLLSARSESEPDPNLTRLIRRPRHTGSADVLMAVTPRGTIGTGIVAVLDREDADFNSFPARRVDPGDYFTMRLYGSWDIGARLVLKARIENLFDRRYEPVYGFPALGRSFTGSLAVRF
ncbi:MAG TPA: TonB-dependent receptor [Gemmatimonadales bacterium]|nr:TonB-dependent receptor [Gemmatimonadales bacterium]